MTNAILRGKPDAGNPHVRFDEGEVSSAKPRRGSLLYKKLIITTVVLLAVVSGAAEYTFSNTAGGSVADTANWKDGTKPADNEPSAIVSATGVASGSTLDFGTGVYSWDSLYFGTDKGEGTGWTISGGTLSLANGFRVSSGRLDINTQLAGESAYLARGTTLGIASAQTGDLALGVTNGRLELNASVSDGSTLAANGTGTIVVPVDQTVKTLAGTHDQGRVEISDGKSLTLNGDAGATEYRGNLTGSGTLVKKGADYELVFAGDHTTNHPFAGALAVQEGSVTLKRAREFVRQLSPTLYWTFDDPADPGAPDVGSLTFKHYTWDSTAGHVASDVNLSSSGVHGRGVHPNGTVFLSAGNNGSMPRSNGSFTILCWAKVAKGATGVRQILGWGGRTTAAGSAFCLRIQPNGGVGVYTTYSDSSLKLTANASVSYRDGRWHQIGATYDGTTVTVYVDGVPSGTVEYALAISNWNFFDLGISSSGSDGDRTPCDIEIDELGVYKGKVLTAEEIWSCYGTFQSVFATEMPAETLPDPIAWYRFDDPGEIGKDSSGNGYHLTAVAGTASKGTMKVPTVDTNSPIHGGMYNSRSGNGCLKWTGDVLPAKIPRGTDPSTVSMWVNASGASIKSATTTWSVFQLGNRRIGSLVYNDFDDTFRRFALNAANSKTWYVLDNDDWFIQKEARETAWHHLAYAHQNGTFAFYVDGRLIGTKSGELKITDTSVLMLGQGTDSLAAGYQYFKGNIDEVKIYDSALTAEQIYADYRCALPRTGDVIDPSTEVAVASGATLTVDGATQTLADLSGAGALELMNDAKLTLAPAAGATFGGAIGGCGTLAIANDMTLSGSCDLSPAGTVEVADATLTVSGTIGNTSIALKEGGALALAQATDADLVFEFGSVIDMEHPIETSGKVTLKPGFTVKAPGVKTRWVTVLTAGEIDATGVDLSAVTFTNLPVGEQGKVKLEGGVLKAKSGIEGIVLIVR